MLEKLFGFDPQKTTVKTEILAGLTTFLTMAYILAVNPNILSVTGMDKGALFTTTALASGCATLLMAFYAKLPFGLAPGMGLNAFFAFTVCQTLGYSWQFALTAVFLEGILFIILTVTNLREKIVDALPLTIKHSISAGIGLFIAFIGLQNAQIVVNNDATLLGLGTLYKGPALVAVIGILITGVMLVKNVRGSLLWGILLTTLVGIPLGVTDISHITSVTEVVSLPPSIEPIFFQFDFENIFSKDMIIVVFTFLFVDMFDTIGTLVGVSTKAGMIDEKGRIPHLRQAFMVDAVGTTAGACLGTSTITTFVESASGVGEGGRSGLTAFVVACFFLFALMFAPVFLAVPGAATAPVLVLVGLMMVNQIQKVDFRDYSEAIPGFVCILMMPLAYSISEGIVLGLLSYVLINALSLKFNKITVSMVILSCFFCIKYFM